MRVFASLWTHKLKRLTYERWVQPAVNDLFLLAFATRRDGPANAQVQTAAELLGGATEAQARAVLNSLRKVILKWSLLFTLH
jgi:hypothetical protein